MKNNKPITRTLLLLLPLIALACGFSRSDLLEPFPTERSLPSPAVPNTETTPQDVPTHASAQTCTVTAENLHLRAEPGTSGTVIAYLKSGDVLAILPDPLVENWVRVQADDLTGWINSNYCKEIP